MERTVGEADSKNALWDPSHLSFVNGQAETGSTSVDDTSVHTVSEGDASHLPISFLLSEILVGFHGVI